MCTHVLTHAVLAVWSQSESWICELTPHGVLLITKVQEGQRAHADCVGPRRARALDVRRRGCAAHARQGHGGAAAARPPTSPPPPNTPRARLLNFSVGLCCSSLALATSSSNAGALKHGVCQPRAVCAQCKGHTFNSALLRCRRPGDGKFCTGAMPDTAPIAAHDANVLCVTVPRDARDAVVYSSSTPGVAPTLGNAPYPRTRQTVPLYFRVSPRVHCNCNRGGVHPLCAQARPTKPSRSASRWAARLAGSPLPTAALCSASTCTRWTGPRNPSSVVLTLRSFMALARACLRFVNLALAGHSAYAPRANTAPL